MTCSSLFQTHLHQWRSPLEMSDNIERIRAELESLGCKTSTFDSPSHGRVVSFSYRVESGSHKKRVKTIGISFQGDERYPEYPPHWIHVTPPIDDGKGGVVNRYSDDHGREWIAMSRPPGDVWDQLRTKNMEYYISEHLRRFWDKI